MSLLEQVRTTVATTLKLPTSRITATTSAEDLAAWDSLGHVNLMMALEQTFDIFIEVEDFDRLKSISSIVAYLDQHGAV